MQIRRKPYQLLLLTALVFLLLSFFVRGETVDIHVHDTYYVAALGQVFGFLALVFFCIWLLYKLTFNILFSGWLTWIHIVGTIVCVFVLLLLSYDVKGLFDSAPRRYYDFSPWISYRTHSMIFAITTLAMLLVQAMYIINIIGGLVKRIAGSTERKTR